MASNDWKARLGVVFSTNPQYEYTTENDTEEEPDTLPPSQQRLRLSIEKAGRKGKIVTVVSGFVGKHNDLAILAKYLKTHLSTGGSVKDGDIIIQGDLRLKIKTLLADEGYSVK